MLSPQWLDELRSRVTLSGVVTRTTKLTRAGREWKACCPFHNEKTPSFTVSDEKGFYHCFGCGAHGDVIRWMTDQRGLTFMDAVRELASEAGMEVPRADPREAAAAERQSGLHDVMTSAQDWFKNNLLAPESEKAREYLATRGFNARTIERFGFGYAPDSRGALRKALGQYDEAMLIEAGLRIQVEDKDPYDRFRDRLMLPIHDARGRVIAFGGRILDKDKKDAPKYLNSPDTPLFDKGRTLYNLHRAGPASRQTGRVVVVEGYMDVIALAAAGLEEAVAPMGTALTERQIELLWRLADKPVLCFDGDAAGQRAAMRAATRALPLLRPGHSLQFVTLPAGMDPDDLVKSRGRDAIEQLLAAPASLLDTLWAHERDAGPLASPEDKAALRARLLDHLEKIQDRNIRSLYRRDLLDRFYGFIYPKREFDNRATGGNRSTGRAKPVTARLSEPARAILGTWSAGGSRDQFVQSVIKGFARHPTQISAHVERLETLRPTRLPDAAAIDAVIEAGELLETDRNAAISLLEPLAMRPDKALFSFLREGADPETVGGDLAEAVDLLVERPALEAAIAKATARFADDPDGAIAEQNRLRQRKLEIESRLGHMARKRAALADTPEAASGHRTDAADGFRADEQETG